MTIETEEIKYRIMSAQIESRDISFQVSALREELGIPNYVEHDGIRYPVYHPTVIIFQNTHDLSQFAVRMNQEKLVEFPNKTVTFPTGGTWEEAYSIMASLPDVSRQLRGRKIATIDEYWPVKPDDTNYPMSYRAYTDERIGIPHGLGPENWIRPDGAAQDPHAEAARFEAALQREDFVIKNLGIGPDPKMANGNVVPGDLDDAAIERLIRQGDAVEGSSHIGFVPRGISPDSGAIFVTLDAGTIFANKKYAPDPDNMPGGAITQAHGDFRNADLRILAATGPFKQRNVERILFSPASPDNPASMVTLGNTFILLDAQAAQRSVSRLGIR